MTQEQLQAEFDKLKAAIFTIPGYQIVTEPVIDLEFGMVICTIQENGSWIYTANIWMDRCSHCGHSCVQYDLYRADQAEESDPDPILETDNIDEVVAFIRN